MLSVGSRRGEAYRLPGAELYDFFQRYNEDDWESALAACHVALDKHPGNALILYNIACMESRLGRATRLSKRSGNRSRSGRGSRRTRRRTTTSRRSATTHACSS